MDGGSRRLTSRRETSRWTPALCLTHRMMESVLSNRPHGRRQSEVDQSKGDVSLDSSTLPHSQLSSPEEREHLQVYLRIRPFTSAESTNGESQDCVSMEPPDTVLLKPPCSSLSARLSADRSLPQTGQRFQFSQVYGPETTQTQMFEGTVKDLVTDVLQGGNSLVFTYGVTNAGKTFTFLGPDADAGILPRSLDVIFSSIDEHVFSETCFKPHRCREFTRLTREQQAEEAAFKRNLFRQLKESERSNTSLLHSTNKTLLEGSSVPGTTVAAEDRIHLQVETHTKFSVWVSFCEIYNENIHDLLEAAPSGAPKRTVLRLSQDVKGNAFVKDLRWVQVNGADEAYKVMKLGKKNQSFSATRLNQLSSRSHSIFSIRILRLEDVGTPRVHNVSELCLCDLAGSERCAKTQNQGERLKEAGNINTSLLILGKCINALRHNQQAKLLQHIPFRESKLTHYLQGFFCGRGKACMIVNINQCASMYDETLNVLKFSAVAQKVVVLSTRPVLIRPLSSAVDESLAVNAADGKCPRSSSRRRSSVIGWESSLEDVQEDVDDEFEEESVLMDDTMDQTGNQGDGDISSQMHQQQGKLVQQLQQQLKKERADGLLMEARVREEISREFSELFSEMQSDYNERLAREREILEERAETRLEIFKNLIDKMTRAGTGGDEQDADKSLDCTSSSFSDLAEIKMAAEAARKCLGSGRAGTVEELERKVLELHEHQRRVEEQEAHKHLGQTGGEEEERRTLLSRLREKSSEISRLEKQVEDLQGATQHRLQGEGESQLLQEAQAALEMEKEARADVLSALEYQTLGKEEALASLEEERKAREELRRGREETLASLEKERQDKETLAASLAEANRRGKETLAALDEERRRAEEARSLLEEERMQIGRLTEQRQVDALQQEVGELAAKLQAAERQLTAETQRAERASQLEELKHKLSEQEDLKLKLGEQQGTVELLKVQLEGSSAADQELKRLNSELQTEVAALRAKVSVIEETKESASDAEAGRAASAEREAELQKTLRDKEAEVTTLQKKLQEAQERRDEDELQAVQDARRREVERRRELLAVAHEAIAQKDEELDKRGEEISRLKEKAEQHSERVKSLEVELQRKDDDASDLREKLADYKKQIQQVQKEISTMREDEKVLRQKLSDAEKTRKQLQSDVANRDRIIQQLRAEQSSDSKSDQTLELYQKTCKELEAKQQVMDDMRLALTEQEETQAQMDDILEEKLLLIQELSHEVEKLKAALLQQDGEADARRQGNSPSHDLRRAKQEAAQAQESLKLCADKHQAERRKWLEEKLSLIGQAKEAEDKRNQEMRKFADDRERYARQQSHVDSLSSRLAEQQQTMDTWRTERDTLVAALEVQLQKLLSSHVEKDKLIQELQQNPTQPPPECGDGGVAELQAALRQREADVQRLEAELKASTVAQGSAGGPSVLDSFEISTENGRASRFPRPELEISFSPLQPNRMALRRQGEENAVTVKITRSARKRKSGEMEKAEVEAENRRNTRTKLTSKLTTHTEETSSPAGRHDSHSSIPSRKEGTLQKIGDFLQSSPTLLGSKAKKMMSLVSGRIEADSAASSSSSSSSSLRAKMNKRKLYRPEISSPMDLPAHPIISREPEERDSDHSIIKRRLRSRMVK
ncbi:Kinesin-like protein [Scophthalmus maximus]|uniref:Kinesin-like protein n=1 Tax=Scophthalmus maximus TaxID=52904 RepID=A0A2U9CDG3_SCOMX|nr:Kinesin-like protein [Scophthalmus maximus]